MSCFGYRSATNWKVLLPLWKDGSRWIGHESQETKAGASLLKEARSEVVCTWNLEASSLKVMTAGTRTEKAKFPGPKAQNYMGTRETAGRRKPLTVPWRHGIKVRTMEARAQRPGERKASVYDTWTQFAMGLGASYKLNKWWPSHTTGTEKSIAMDPRCITVPAMVCDLTEVHSAALQCASRNLSLHLTDYLDIVMPLSPTHTAAGPDDETHCSSLCYFSPGLSEFRRRLGCLEWETRTGTLGNRRNTRVKVWKQNDTTGHAEDIAVE